MQEIWTLGLPTEEGHGLIGSKRRAAKITRGLQHVSYEDRLRVLGLLIWEVRRP